MLDEIVYIRWENIYDKYPSDGARPILLSTEFLRDAHVNTIILYF